MDEYQMRLIRALESIDDHLRRIDDIMQVMAHTFERLETDVQP